MKDESQKVKKFYAYYISVFKPIFKLNSFNKKLFKNKLKIGMKQVQTYV